MYVAKYLTKIYVCLGSKIPHEKKKESEQEKKKEKKKERELNHCYKKEKNPLYDTLTEPVLELE